MVTHESGSALCTECEKEIVPIQDPCPRCGAPSQSPSPQSLDAALTLGLPAIETPRKTKIRQEICRFCKGHRWAFERVWCYTIYHSNAAQAVRLIKEARCEPLTHNLGDLLAKWLLEQKSFHPSEYDCIVPIPQHWLRRLSHRYNQSAALGLRLSNLTKLPCQQGILRRSRWTEKQGMKTISERRENLLGAFVASNRKSVHNRRFLLIDDVMTSGATLHEAAKALKDCGASRVDAAVFARGVNASKPPGKLDSGGPTKDPLTFDKNLDDPPESASEAIRRKIH